MFCSLYDLSTFPIKARQENTAGTGDLHSRASCVWAASAPGTPSSQKSRTGRACAASWWPLSLWSSHWWLSWKERTERKAEFEVRQWWERQPQTSAWLYQQDTAAVFRTWFPTPFFKQRKPQNRDKIMTFIDFLLLDRWLTREKCIALLCTLTLWHILVLYN